MNDRSYRHSTVTRSEAIRALAATATAAVVLPERVLAASPAPRVTRKIICGVATKTITPYTMNLCIGQELGYLRDEGLELELKALGSFATQTEALRRGQITFAVGSPPVILPIVARGETFPAIQFYEYTYPFKYDWVVMPDSPIKTYADLRGKKLAVANFGTSEKAIGERLLVNAGVPLQSEKWSATGEGLPSYIALQRGDVDAMIYYDNGFGSWDVAGFKYHLLPRPKNIPQVGGFYIGATPATLEKDRATAVAYGRAVAKATVFARENPEAGARVFLKMFPEAITPSKSLDENVHDAMLVSYRRIKLWSSPDPSVKKIGYVRPVEWKDEIVFAGLEGKVPNVERLYTNALIDEINRFDANAVRREARAYKA